MLRVNNRILSLTEPLHAMSERDLLRYREAILSGMTIIGRELPRFQMKIEDIDQELEWRAADSKK